MRVDRGINEEAGSEARQYRHYETLERSELFALFHKHNVKRQIERINADKGKFGRVEREYSHLFAYRGEVRDKEIEEPESVDRNGKDTCVCGHFALFVDFREKFRVGTFSACGKGIKSAAAGAGESV